MRKARRAELQSIRLVGAIGDDVDAELSLRMLDCRIRFAWRHVDAFGEELEVMDELLHVRLHLFAGGRRHLVVRGDHRSRVLAQPVDTLLDDLVRLAKFLHSHEIAIVTVAIGAYRNVKLHPVVHFVGLLLAQIPCYARAAKHRTGESER